jgi:2'-hydroxyisoflavone reductase
MQEKVQAWSEMPLWLPEDSSKSKGFMFVNCERAVNSGLVFRPLSETIQDTLTWREKDCPNEVLKAGINSDKEQSLLRKWHATHERKETTND